MRKVIYFLLICFLVGLYLFRFEAVKYTLHEGDKARVVGTISDVPKYYGNKQRVVVDSFSFFTSAQEDYQYGDKIQVVGKVKNQNGKWSINNPQVEKIKSSKNLLLAFNFRQKIIDYYAKVLPPAHANLLAGIVLGTKSSLDSRFFNQLRNTGTLHVVVASGTNVSLFSAALLYLLTPFIKRPLALSITLVIVWFYILVIGWQAPIVRAGVMISIAYFAQGLGREGSAAAALLTTAGVMLLINPLWLFDLGFQLSFLSTLGIIVLSPKILNFLSNLGHLTKLPKAILNDFSTSFGAQIAVFPLIFFKFGQIPWSAPVVNPLVLWSVAPIMAGGMVLGALTLFGRVGEAVGQVLAWFLWLPLEYFVRIVNLFGNF